MEAEGEGMGKRSPGTAGDPPPNALPSSKDIAVPGTYPSRPASKGDGATLAFPVRPASLGLHPTGASRLLPAAFLQLPGNFKARGNDGNSAPLPNVN